MRSLVRAAFALLLGFALLGATSDALYAQRGEPKRKPPKTKRIEALGKRVFTLLNKANEALQAEDYETAEKRLTDLLDPRQKLNSHEESMVHQTFGHLYSSQERYQEAIVSFEKALDADGLSDSAKLNTQYYVGQLHMLLENYDRGIAILTEWFEQAENPAADAYMLMANAHAQRAAAAPDSEERRHYQEAWKWARQGLEKMVEPREPWMRLGSQLSLALGNWKTALYWLEGLVRNWPKENYLKQLTAVHGQLENADKALVAMEIAQLEDYLDESREIVRLSQLYLYNEVPYKAAVLMQTNMDSEVVEENKENYELLANAWTMARHYDRALGPLREAASRSDDGRLWVRLGRLHLDDERWKDAANAIRKGLDKGDLKNEGEAWLLLGIAEFQRGRFIEARKSFTRASKDPKTRKSGRQWIQALDARAQ